MGGIARVAGAIGSTDAVRQGIGGAASQILTDSAGGIGPLLNGIMGSIGATLTQVDQGMKGSMNPAQAQSLMNMFQSDLSRLAYIAALNKAAKKAQTSGNSFNIETAMNDLWNALDAVKQAEAVSTPQQQADVMSSISTMLKNMDDMAGSVIRNMR